MRVDRVRLVTWMGLALLSALFWIAVVMCVAGCGTRITPDQASHLSQARADVQASREQTVDQPTAVKLLAAAGARTMAATENLDLPAPQTPPAVLIVPPAPEQEMRAAQAAEKDPPVGMLGYIAAGVGGVGLAALGALRFMPGTFGVVADLAHNWLAPKATKQMRDVEQQSFAVAQQAVAYGHAVSTLAEQAGLGDKVEQLKSTFSDAQDKLGVKPQIDALLAAFKTGKLPIKPQDPT